MEPGLLGRRAGRDGAEMKEALSWLEGFLPVLVIVHGWYVHGADFAVVIGGAYFLLTVTLDLGILHKSSRVSNPAIAARAIKWALFLLLYAGITLSGWEANRG